MRRQQLDAACDSHRTHCPSSPSCCDLSSSASLVIRNFAYRCRPGLITCNTVLSAPIASATALTIHWSSRSSASLQSAHTINVRSFWNLGSSSRVLDHLKSPPLRNQIVVAAHPRVSFPRSRVGRRSPRCCRPSRPEWKRRLSSLGNVHSRTAASSTRHRINGVGSGRRDTRSTRVPRAAFTLHTIPSPKNCSLQPKGVRHNVAHSPEDTYYILW